MEVRVDSNLIKAERENRGWTQSHLATVAGLSLRTIQRIEKTGSASLESVSALASVFSMELADLRAGEALPGQQRAIRVSLELPVRLVLAVLSGVLCALHFQWRFFGDWPNVGFGWPDFALAGMLFAVTVLCPYLRSGNGFLIRALGLIGASALSYYCAIATQLSDAWLPVAPVLTSYLLASLVGVSIVLVAAKFLIPLRVTPAFWILGMAAGLIGGLAMYTGLEILVESLPSTIIRYSSWHMLACLAIYLGHDSSGARDGLLAAIARTRGRFSIVPGWMRLSYLRRRPLCVKAGFDSAGASTHIV